jgi:uncharacterized protein YaiL (DUF2058 family)
MRAIIGMTCEAATVGNSLQDELLKAGLVDKAQVDRARKQQHQQRRQQAQAKPKKKARRAQPAVDPAVAQARAEKAAHDRELNAQREEVRRQREVNAQVRQLVSRHRHARVEREDDRPFHFENKGKIKRIFVDDETQAMITSGRLKIVNDNGQFELVPADIAEKIRARNPSLVIDLPENEQPAADDPYAAYQVPDDLMW